MKNLRSNLALGLLAALFLIVFSACNKDQDVILETAEELETPSLLKFNVDIAADVQVENGVLVFQNLDDYRSTLLGLNRLSTSEQLNWEKSIGFISMQQLFNDLMNTEWNNSKAVHSDKYLQALNSGLITEQEFGYDLNIFNPTYAAILSENGIVKVGDDLFQFTANSLKKWRNGNILQLETIMQTRETTDEIQVIPMQTGIVNLRDDNNWTEECLQENEGSRMIVTVVFYSDFEEPNFLEIIFVKYYINIKSQIDNGNGYWQYDQAAQLKLEGISHSQFELSDGNNLYYKNFEQAYQFVGQSGNHYLVCEESGNYKVKAPFFFTQPARLITSSWYVKNHMSTDAGFVCEISK